MSKLAVVALGGNALLRAGQKGTIEEQEKNTYAASVNLIKLIPIIGIQESLCLDIP